ncbi:FGGY-family carbohydrate kinase [Marinovum sp. 2_MG-2023]|uniref:FGGY-family carbohydrate kinase n=1 Tax=unclassified Marinovum TaxID=2647166 RepID=UPI0026E2345A|nr:MULTISPECIES: FGGY-family carbohydrate kinase [unclassified Marinovum]MDO6730893.1 FGGY-family carbohydrate kinase [Marinovum sp. 2_MG-2023]MDO6780120.1 FGGY-family carbohydrate kinase [Marinovum sp. 1_MG-2023]
MADSSDLIIGVDAGTSVIKAVAFDLAGRQIAAASVRNSYVMGADGSATQSLPQTWSDCAAALRGLGDKITGLARRTAAVALTGQGDGTWLAGADNAAVTDAWLWLDARAAPTVRRLAAGPDARARFEATGTGLNTCQQGSQMAHMDATCPEILDRAEVALHCKDWLFLNLTGTRATDPSEASFTFGDFRTRAYSDRVIAALGLTHRRHLMPDIIDGAQDTRPLTAAAAAQTGLRAGTPVSLGYVDMVMTALGAGVHTGDAGAACSTVGSTGVHMRAVTSDAVHLNAEGTGYVICLPVPNLVTQVQTNMAATLNIDWALSLAEDLMSEVGKAPSHADMVARIDGWMARSHPGALVYHPYISEAGERGPFVNADARASLVGLNAGHRFPDVIRAVIEGLGMAARDCYAAMGDMPRELRLTGGAARSAALRRVLAAALNTPVRVSAREEAGAAGCAMMAAVAIGAYDTMDACIADWTTPLLNSPEPPDPDLVPIYDRLFTNYRHARSGLAPVWDGLAAARHAQGA